MLELLITAEAFQATLDGRRRATAASLPIPPAVGDHIAFTHPGSEERAFVRVTFCEGLAPLWIISFDLRLHSSGSSQTMKAVKP